MVKNVNGKQLLWLMGLTLASGTALADETGVIKFKASVDGGRAKTYRYPKIYPFAHKAQSEIYSDVSRVTEDKYFIKNFHQIMRKGLHLGAKTTEKPWTASYWPLSKGTIADPYEDSKVGYYVDTDWIDWDSNYDTFKKRKKDVLANIDSLTEEELAKLAPSEKYDLLLGDKSYDLTHRLWEYMKAWGNKKEWGFISRLYLTDGNALNLAQNFVSWGWYGSVEEAFRADNYQLKGNLAVDIALKLKDRGKFDSVEEAFPTALDMAKEQEGEYVLTKKNKRIAAWEGICNGWSTAAGAIPRPRKPVDFKLPNGKKLKFYPADIKGLVSLYWVNSLIQDNLWTKDNGSYGGGGTISAGLRCNLKNAKRDLWGRKYDHKDDPFNGRNFKTNKRDSRCAGVHPATWHLGLVNLIGNQGRSFVVERKVGAEVDNHPMYSYKMKYFNPATGKYKEDMEDNIVEADKTDQFRLFRNPKTKYLVGVKTEMVYLDYTKPRRQDKDSEKEDSDVTKKMFYDLELDENYNVIGGQWRTVEVGIPPEKRSGSRTKQRPANNQPDFFWTITKNWKQTGLFDDDADLPRWNNKKVAPPASWLSKAKDYHSFEYKEQYIWGSGRECKMVNKKTGKVKTVACDKSTNKPQPLSNVVNALIELSK